MEIHIKAPVAGLFSFLLVFSVTLNVYFFSRSAQNGAKDPSEYSGMVDIDTNVAEDFPKDFEVYPRLQEFGRSDSVVDNSIRHAQPRDLSSTSSSQSSSQSKHGPHQHDALIFLFNALLIGTAVMHLQAIYPCLQQTIILFILGVLFSLLMEGANLKDHLGVFGESYEMWLDIDPHLLMFTMLPALLAGDAMSIDTSVARRVAFQCLYLAGPGVLISAMCTAAFLSLYLDWSFLLSLVAGAILCATDPVAVVALLKELGASPMLTVQIQGESLLNDGTAIVLFLIAYNSLGGQNYDAADIAMFLVKKAMMAWALGLFIGYIFYSWIRVAGNRLNHGSSIIQISLTLCCAYWSYIMVEGVLSLSGVLATVASSLILAHHMWPHIVSPESLNNVWHTLEALGNMIVFFLAGALTGDVMVRTKFGDYMNLVVIYLFLLLLRGGLIFASRPLLRYLSADKQEVTLADATLMTWGGLRGAVGLSLAILVHRERATNTDGIPQIDVNDAERLLFFVSGIAFLTMVVNASTAPALVQYLGIIALPQARLQLLRRFHKQLVNWSQDSANPPEVTDALIEMLEEAQSLIDNQQVSKEGPKSCRTLITTTSSLGRLRKSPSNIRPRSGGASPGAQSVHTGHTSPSRAALAAQQSDDLITELKAAEDAFTHISSDDLKLFGHLPANLLGNVDGMVALVSNNWVDEGMAKVVNSCFLNLVYANYWKLIEMGDLRPGSPEADTLLTSIRVSLGPYRADLTDFSFVLSHILEADKRSTELISPEENADTFSRQYSLSAVSGGRKGIAIVVHSMCFNVSIALAIVLNSIQVAVEEAARNDDNDDHIAWFLLDLMFLTIFLVEFVLKFSLMRCRYFKDPWNCFDFMLVFIGLLGVFMEILMSDSREGDASQQSRVIRITRVFRTLRFLRVFRLFNAKLNADKYVSMSLARHMKKIQTLLCFVHAHLMGQNDLIKYFGNNGELDSPEETELARCILQSQVSVYRALVETAKTQHQLSKSLLEELQFVYERKTITENLEKFVMSAHKDGAVSGREAHAIMHPLHHQIAHCMAVIHERAEGLVDREVYFGQKRRANSVAWSIAGSVPITFRQDMAQGSAALVRASSATYKSGSTDDEADVCAGGAIKTLACKTTSGVANSKMAECSENWEVQSYPSMSPSLAFSVVPGVVESQHSHF